MLLGPRFHESLSVTNWDIALEYCDTAMYAGLATVCGIEWNVNAAAFTPQNGAIVCTDSVCMKAHLQNFETCMRNLHW